MRRLTQAAVVLSAVALSPPALAQDAAKKPPEMPKPAPALTDAFKGMTGTWACKGKAQKMDGSGEIDTQSTMVLRSELDGFAYAGTYQMGKNSVMPSGMKGQMFWTYDASTNKLVEFYADNAGGVGRGTSDGLKGTATAWDEDGVMMGKASKTRTTVTRISPTEVTLTFEMQADGKWSQMGHTSCKKH